jgi:hypothetical protein
VETEGGVLSVSASPPPQDARMPKSITDARSRERRESLDFINLILSAIWQKIIIYYNMGRK